MESSVTNNLGKTGQALADKAADKVQSGIRSAQDTAKDAGGVLSNKVEDLRGEAGSALGKAADRVQSMGKQGLDAITNVTSQARDVASKTSDSIVGYTKRNPVRALAIAAGSGALLYAAIKALRPPRG
jgi:ElaB/YqjD/DUF883 family membrane-anchored ribosome-binding protein